MTATAQLHVEQERTFRGASERCAATLAARCACPDRPGSQSPHVSRASARSKGCALAARRGSALDSFVEVALPATPRTAKKTIAWRVAPPPPRRAPRRFLILARADGTGDRVGAREAPALRCNHAKPVAGRVCTVRSELMREVGTLEASNTSGAATRSLGHGSGPTQSEGAHVRDPLVETRSLGLGGAHPPCTVCAVRCASVTGSPGLLRRATWP
jgi:hypothetical protein